MRPPTEDLCASPIGGILNTMLHPLSERGITIEGLLGVGGTSEVLSVRNAAGERFALKRLLSRFRGSRAHRDAILLEGVHLSLVRSPKVIRCHELLTLPLPQELISADPARDPSAEAASRRGEVTLLLDHVPGMHLRSLMKSIQRGTLPFQPEEVASIISDLSQGIYMLHRARRDQDRPCPITHGDLSPTNVIIRTDGVAILIDLSSASSVLTRSYNHPRPGKRSYLSPARRRGELEGPPGDLYALGVIWFELVTGAQPDPRLLIRERELARSGWPAMWAKIVSGLLSPSVSRREEVFKQISKSVLWRGRSQLQERKMLARRALRARVSALSDERAP